jgi:ligand-binding sensor domain-containing protein/signal transduction histidine kinase
MRRLLLFTFIIFSSLVFLAVPAIAQQDFMFNHLTVDDGLSTNNVRCFVQDYQGFIWIGTENGLHRYDGYELRIYQNDHEDPNSIGGNFIMSLHEDAKRRLWIGTLEGGVSIYDREKDQFINFSHRPNDSTTIAGQTVGTFYEDQQDRLWLTTEQGSICYVDQKSFDPQNPVFNNIMLPGEYFENGFLWISNMVEKEEDVYWLGIHGAGLIAYDLKTNSFYNEIDDSSSYPFFFDKRVRGLYKDAQGRLWIMTWGGGIYLYFHKDKKLLKYSHEVSNPNSLANNLVASVLEDKQGNFWVGSDDGLCLMNDFSDRYPAGVFTTLTNDPFDDRSLSTNAVKPIYQDRQGRIWVGTYFGGANIYDPNYFRFKTIKSHPLREGSLPGDNITAISQDSNGNMWIGTDKSGLCVLEGGYPFLESNNYRYIELTNPVTGVKEKKIKALEFDRAGYLWIGTWGGGLFRYDPKTRKTKHYHHTLPNQLPSESILSLAIDDNDLVWIASFSGGLACLNPQTDKFTYYRFDINNPKSLGNDKINALLIDQENQLWIGTEGGGLNLLDRDSNEITRISVGNLLSTLNIISLYQCHDGYIWVGSHSNGLFRLDPSNLQLKQYTADFGLLGNLIQSIHEDIDHYLWIGTNHGLSKFVFSSNEVVHFSVEEGLQSKQFNPNAVFLCKDGTMIFGGVEGMNAFVPSKISKSEVIPNVVFTDFWLNNEIASFGLASSPLDENLTVAKDIVLEHDQNSFSVRYAALEYDFSNRTKYLTFMQGFEEEWQNRGSERKITYTNMPPGEYILRVKAVNKDGFVADRDERINITIKPVWYQTGTFWILLAVTVIGLTYSIIQLRINFFKKQSRKLEDIVAIRTRELHEKSIEIQSQNKELTAQNDQISEQREELESARDQLTKMNSELEELVQERTRKLEKTISELDRFVYSASHDLSAPLKSILGLLNIAKADRDKERVSEYLNYMEESILKLEEVIKSLVSYSRNSRLTVRKEHVNLYDLLQSIMKELAYFSSDGKIDFKIHVDESTIINTDRQRLKIILHNIISNCIKYSDAGKPEQKVKITCITKKKHSEIRIWDNGIGIEKDQLRKVFSMFYRATEKSTGSGLGLFIVKETLVALNGKIQVVSEIGQYSEFTIELPD